MTEAATPFRILPELTNRNRHFWQGGRDGQLVFLRCQDCGYYIHPPTPICPRDRSKHVAAEPVSGRAVVTSYTVNHHPWLGPAVELPYVIGLVEMIEQAELRLTTNIINCPPESVHVGMDVRVVFEHHEDPNGDVWLPLFEPLGGAGVNS
ncbi:MAG TPA: OB-fold domain-containing protein [Acidimicrobiales bacterium]|nr:OB-fold domain-containing protein [Acidimicrobiales bacterium]